MSFQIPNLADVATGYERMSDVFSSDLAIVEAAQEGYYVISGSDTVAGTNAGTVKLNTGTIFNTTVGEYKNTAVQDNIACCANADATNPVWELIEIDSSGVAQVNLGTADPSPNPPAPTAGRTVSAAIWIPANATAVDALLSTANGNAKIIDKRVIRSTPYTRQIWTDDLKTLTNPTTLTSLMNATHTFGTVSHTSSGDDTLHGWAHGWIINNAANSTVRFQMLCGGSTILDYTTAVLTTSANLRPWSIRVDARILDIGTVAVIDSSFMIGVQSGTSGVNTAASAQVAEAALARARLAGTLDGAAWDLKALFGTSSTGATIVGGGAYMQKTSAT